MKKLRYEVISKSENNIMGRIYETLVISALLILIYSAFFSVFKIQMDNRPVVLTILIASLLFNSLFIVPKILKRIVFGAGFSFTLILVYIAFKHREILLKFYYKGIILFEDIFLNIYYGEKIKYTSNIYFMIILCFLMADLALIFVMVINARKCLAIPVLICFVPIITSGICGLFPGSIYCLPIFAFLFLFINCYYNVRNTISYKRIIQIAVIFLVVFILTIPIKPFIDDYKKDNIANYKSTRKKIAAVIDTDYFGMIKSKFSGIMWGLDIWNTSNEVDLTNADRRNYSGTKEMKVTLGYKPGNDFYLKAFTGVTYDGKSWKPVDEDEAIQLVDENNLDIDDDSMRKIVSNTFDRVIEYNMEKMMTSFASSKVDAPVTQGHAVIDILHANGEIAYIPYYANISEDYTVSKSGKVTSNNTKQQSYDYYPYTVINSLKKYIGEYNVNEKNEEYQKAIRSKYCYQLPDSVTGLEAFVEKYKLDNADAVYQQLNRFFDDGFEYTLKPGRVPRGDDFAEYFLYENKKGFCVHFATAATLIYREYGIAAKYVEGYKIPTDSFKEQKDGTYVATVTDEMAHAWCETADDDINWVIREHTISSDNTREVIQSQANLNQENVTASWQDETEIQTTKESQSNNTQGETNKQDTSYSRQDTNMEFEHKTVLLLLKIMVAIVLISLYFAVVITKTNRNLKRAIKSGNKGARYIFCKFYNFGMHILKHHRYDEEKKIFEEIMSAYPILKEEEWRWVYEQARRATFSNDVIAKEDNKKMYDLYMKFRKEILKDMSMLKRASFYARGL